MEPNCFPLAPVEFLFGGNCTFTVKAPDGDHRTFKVQYSEPKPKNPDDPDGPKWPEAWWVKLLTGPDNTSDYQPVGKLDRRTGKVIITRNSKFTPDSLPVRLLEFVAQHVLAQKDLPGGLVIQAPSHCGRCGRLLTAPREKNPYFPWLGPECGSKG